MAIRDDYQQFTAKYRRVILEKLRDATLAAETAGTPVAGADGVAAAKPGDGGGVDSPQTFIPEQSGTASGAGAVAPLTPAPAEDLLYCEIDIQGAEKLSSGSLLFPSWNSNEAGGWCIMVKSDRNDADLFDEYEIVGRIKNETSGPEFMALA